MPRHSATRRVRHSPAQMFALVADVEQYPEFISLCEGMRVISRSPGETVAAMTIGYKAFRESFTSRITLDEPAGRLHVAAIDGPFRTLTNDWEFRPAPGGGTEIAFTLDYEFRSRLLAVVMGAVFDKAFGKFSDAFVARADQLYPETAESSSVSPA